MDLLSGAEAREEYKLSQHLITFAHISPIPRNHVFEP